MKKTGTKGKMCVGLATGIVGFAAVGAMGGPVEDGTIRAFVEFLDNTTQFDAETRREVARRWATRDEDYDPETFLIDSLADLSQKFRAGLDAYENDDYAKVFEIMDELARESATEPNENPFLSANASVFAIKAIVEQRKYEDAAKRLETFLADPTAVDLFTCFAAETAFLKGYLELQNIRYDDAMVSLETMLDRYPHAASRLRTTARQMLAELRSRRPERIGDVNDLMIYAERQLGRYNTGQRVQERQQRAVDLLDQLIEEAESREQSSGGGGGSGQQTPNTPMQESQLPGGDGAGVHLRSTRKVRPGEAWGAMQPAERDKILQALHDRFPSRYRELVEQYYKELSKQP